MVLQHYSLDSLSVLWRLAQSLQPLEAYRDRCFAAIRRQPDQLTQSLAPLLTRLLDRRCAIPRDRIFSILPSYMHGKDVKVDYAMADDESVCSMAKGLRELPSFCSIMAIVYGLHPQTRLLGHSFVDVEFNHELPLESSESIAHNTASHRRFECDYQRSALPVTARHELFLQEPDLCLSQRV